MSRLCREVASSLGRPLSTLSEAERLQLEQHVSECEACSRESALSRVVGELIRSAPSGLSESARERALRGAFAHAAQAVPASRASSRGARWGLGVAAAAVVVLASSALRMEHKRSNVLGRATPPTAVDTTARSPAPAAVAVAPRAASDVGAAPREDDWVESTSAETRTFGGARVALAERTRVRFERASNTLELARGQVTLDVEPQHERPFAVLTQGFRVEVLGTQFVVSPERVTVITGHVEVRDRDSNRLISDLRTGQSYGNESATRSTSSEESASKLIRQARSALGDGDVQAARTLVQRAERAARKASDRAEVATLDAECELLARRPAQAIDAYLRVADRYPGLPAGENALFAAAQLSLRQRDASAARTLFERYLQRHPTGRFADEARAHLRSAR